MRVLISGATGFIGRRLATRLAADGLEVRCLVRDREAPEARRLRAAGCDVAAADLAVPADLAEPMAGVEIAYFLVHMIGSGEGYPERERAGAVRFARSATEAGVRRVIYLGGLGDGEEGSRHLASRHQVAEALEAEGPPLTYFRAGMVIGPGSESYELLRSIVERLVALPAPDWLKTRTQPIGVDDVVAYLRDAPARPQSAGREIQIGGPHVVTHLELIEEMARALGRRPPRLVPVSAEIARLATVAAAAGAVTAGSAEVATEISLGLSETTVVDDRSGAELFEIRPRPLAEVLTAAVDAEAAREER
jgi:uncharacterized protein YbjT (DUF2867 family)